MNPADPKNSVPTKCSFILSKDDMKYYKLVTAAFNISNTAKPVPFNANYRLVSTGISHSSLAKKNKSRLN